MSFGSLPSVLGNGGGVAISVIGGTGLFADGTAAAPSISFASDTDTGFYRVAANIIGVANNGSISLAFVAGGKIQGSGLDNELTLAGNGSVSLRAGGTNQNITLTPSGTGKTLVGGNKDGSILTLLRNASAYSFHLGVTANSDFAIYDNNGTSVLATITNTNGRFLLGTTTDSGALLQIGTNTTTSAGGMVFGDDTFLHRYSSGQLRLIKAGNASFVICDSSLVADAKNWDFLVGSGGLSGRAINDANNSANTWLNVTRSGITISSIALQTGAGTTALTLSATQAATFASTVSAAGNVILNQGTYLLLNGAADLNSGLVRLAGNTILSAGGDVILKSGGTTVLTGTSTGAVTLGGALKLANAYVAGAVVGTGYVTIQDSTGTTYRVPVLV